MHLHFDLYNCKLVCLWQFQVLTPQFTKNILFIEPPYSKLRMDIPSYRFFKGRY